MILLRSWTYLLRLQILYSIIFVVTYVRLMKNSFLQQSFLALVIILTDFMLNRLFLFDNCSGWSFKFPTSSWLYNCHRRLTFWSSHVMNMGLRSWRQGLLNLPIFLGILFIVFFLNFLDILGITIMKTRLLRKHFEFLIFILQMAKICGACRDDFFAVGQINYISK